MPFMGMPQIQIVRDAGDREDVPPRVRFALEFLRELNLKGATRAAANDFMIEQIPGQKLTSDEVNARAAACSMLQDYFNGKMRLNIWEKDLRLEETRYPYPAGPGQFLACFNCLSQGGRVKEDCDICGGCGRILVFPTNKGDR